MDELLSGPPKCAQKRLAALLAKERSDALAPSLEDDISRGALTVLKRPQPSVATTRTELLVLTTTTFAVVPSLASTPPHHPHGRWSVSIVQPPSGQCGLAHSQLRWDWLCRPHQAPHVVGEDHHAELGEP